VWDIRGRPSCLECRGYGPSLQDGYRQAGLADEPEADVQEPPINVRLSGQSRHRKLEAPCLLLTQSGHLSDLPVDGVEQINVLPERPGSSLPVRQFAD
jgi:hypothetical protein